jgi:hypothetical protein
LVRGCGGSSCAESNPAGRSAADRASAQVALEQSSPGTPSYVGCATRSFNKWEWCASPRLTVNTRARCTSVGLHSNQRQSAQQSERLTAAKPGALCSVRARLRAAAASPALWAPLHVRSSRRRPTTVSLTAALVRCAVSGRSVAARGARTVVGSLAGFPVPFHSVGRIAHLLPFIQVAEVRRGILRLGQSRQRVHERRDEGKARPALLSVPLSSRRLHIQAVGCRTRARRHGWRASLSFW